MKVKRLFLRICLLMMCMGFRLISPNRWGITENDPTLWLRFCGDSRVGIEQMIEDIMDDINGIESSFLRLALYPADPDNPGTPLAGDSTFTLVKGGVRTIDICFESIKTLGAIGESSQLLTDDKVTGCTIKLKKSLKTGDANELKSTLAHEIGHCLGLGHPQETNQSIMSYFDSESTTYRTDDMMGLSYLYPKSINGVDYDETPSYGLGCSVK